ncbi:TPA: hypothetical protein ACS7ZY_001420 [Providencia alcalifaciens]
MKSYKYIICFAVGFLLLYLALPNTNESPKDKEKNKDRDVIKLCWNDYEKKSISTEAKQFIASVCEAKEDDFKKKYGVKP